LGISVDDLRTMRSGGYLLTVRVLLKMVRVGGFDPRSIIEGPSLRKLSPGQDTRGAQQRFVNARMRTFARSINGLDWARRTGLSSVGVYSLRYGKTSQVKLVTVLAFCAIGPSLEEIIFGN
jgi:DNA-binding Xre family transcriptional regulator